MLCSRWAGDARIKLAQKQDDGKNAHLDIQFCGCCNPSKIIDEQRELAEVLLSDDR